MSSVSSQNERKKIHLNQVPCTQNGVDKETNGNGFGDHCHLCAPWFPLQQGLLKHIQYFPSKEKFIKCSQ